MSDEHMQQLSALTPPQKPAMTDEHRWGEPIPPERQAALDGYLQRWAAEEPAAGGKSHGEWAGPFALPDKIHSGVPLTGSDVFYLATRALAGGLSADAEALAAARSRLHADQFGLITGSQRITLDLSGLHLEGADLTAAHLEGAQLGNAHLEGAWLNRAYLEQADFNHAHLEGARLGYTHLERAELRWAHLERADLAYARLEEVRAEGVCLRGAELRWVHLERADLDHAHLEGANLGWAHLEGAVLAGAHLEGADLDGTYLAGAQLGNAHLEGTNFSRAHLEGAWLNDAHLEGAQLRDAQLERARLEGAHLEGKAMLAEDLARIRAWAPEFPARLSPADQRLAFLSEATTLNGITLGTNEHGYVRVADVRWGGVNLAVVRWPDRLYPPVAVLGDERIAHQAHDDAGKPKSREERLEDYRAAVRANRQLAVALQTQGMSEEAARFAYRAQLLQQQVLLRQRKFGAYLFARFLDALAGYGYKPVRGLSAYVLVIAGFAFAYSLATQGVLTFGLAPSQLQPLQWYEALVLSISSFHGRGFFQPVQSLGDPVAILAAGEAIIGLLIEISFIATFTQRFFGAK
jgi:uncharacterized protein YjbI with pentapeptide repeats